MDQISFSIENSRFTATVNNRSLLVESLTALKIFNFIPNENQAQLLRAEKSNKYARVLAAYKSPKFEKMAGISLIL